MCDLTVYTPPPAAVITDPEYIYVKVEGNGQEQAEKNLRSFFEAMNANQLRAFNLHVKRPGDIEVSAGPSWLIAGPMWYMIMALRKPIGPPTYEQWLEENK